MPMTVPNRVRAVDSSSSSLVNRPGVVPMAIKTPNSLVRSKMAMRKVFKILKATTMIKITYIMSPLTRSI